MKALILGVGNTLLCDEGIGVYAVQELEKFSNFAPHFDIVDGGTCGMELLDCMANRKHLIIIDAVLAGKKPGDIVVMRNEEVPVFFSRKISPHQLGICDVLSALKLTDEFPENLCLIGIQPESLTPQIGLSETLRRRMPQIFFLLDAELARFGLPTGAAHV